MSPDIHGLHHVTALCGEPARNLWFYTQVLGLRLVKKTVNFDDPHAYHFYFGDRTGRPGTLITFFPHPAFRPGSPGAREVAVTHFAVPAGALGYWSDRLHRAGLALERESNGGRERLAFRDPDGTRLTVGEAGVRLDGFGAPEASVPPDRAIAGLAGVTTVVNELAPTAEFLTTALGFRSVGGDATRAWFEPGSGSSGQRIEVVEDPTAPRPTLGVGSVHHVAWRVADDAARDRVRLAVDGKVTGLTPTRDRNYFRSIYFREPGGVIFEVATDVPGFLVDEDEASLGTELKLPPQFEGRRTEIEAALPPLEVRS
jgi:glyoxalase family protein